MTGDWVAMRVAVSKEFSSEVDMKLKVGIGDNVTGDWGAMNVASRKVFSSEVEVT